MTGARERSTTGAGAGDGTAGDASIDARSKLTDVAERLFAKYGIEAVPLRTVGAHAGQRNNSVAQYHFGSKEGLIATVTTGPEDTAPTDQVMSELVTTLAPLWTAPDR